MSDEFRHERVSSSNEADSSKQKQEISKGNELFRIVDMSIEIEKERRKVQDAITARDATVKRLVDAYNSLRQKTVLLESLQNQSPGQPVQTSQVAPCATKSLEERKMQKDKENDSGPQTTIEHESFNSKNHLVAPFLNPFVYHRTTPPVLSRTSSGASIDSVSSTASNNSCQTILQIDDNDLDFTIVRSSPSGEAEDLIEARNKLLASIPLPADAPEDALKPIMIPSSYTLHEFLGLLRNPLSNYRALNELTTSWCPQREEHGYFLTPVFKCSTNPRVTTAHRWSSVDVFECFYNKSGQWYYAGVYKAFRLDDLTQKEWEALSNETTQAIIKETLAGRKNISPQNVYETAQLYAAGALKVACIGLQCVGFNKALYYAILDQVAKLNQSNGKRKQGAYGDGSGADVMRACTGTPGHHSRTGSRDIIDGLAGLQVSGRHQEEGEGEDKAR
uniref:DUF6697 domain-containing protein n=2 Tax=Moniliophthora roreri TaxID=221103 RepID=A0A0W0G7Y6_MONRR